MSLLADQPPVICSTWQIPQENVSLAWCLDRLQLAFTALSLPELGAIEKQTHTILYAAGGLPSNGLYIDYATALWEAAKWVRSLQHVCRPLLPCES